MDAQTFHTTEGGTLVDTEQGCSACGGNCPCPQACERREEALRAQKPLGLVRGLAAAVFRVLT